MKGLPMLTIKQIISSFADVKSPANYALLSLLIIIARKKNIPSRIKL